MRGTSSLSSASDGPTGTPGAAAEGHLRVETLEGGVRVLTLERPARRNALSESLVRQLSAALAPDALVRALLVRGAGTTFCAGSDVGQLRPGAPQGPLPDEALMACLGQLEAYPAPTVALVEGAAFGGGFDLAAACDLRVGAHGATFCIPAVRLGVVYPPEGVARAVRLVGHARARRLLLTGQVLGADEALGWGLLDELHPAAEAPERALALCRTLAAHAPLALAGMKETLLRLARAPALDADERAALWALRARAWASEDFQEGRAAFLQKRPPTFRGR
jgi:enoyl-CoA hydratase/carnithine racemase